MIEITIPILTGCFFNLELFDFSFKGLKIINVESPEFLEYIIAIDSDYHDINSWKYIDTITEHKRALENTYAIIKTKIPDQYDIDDIYTVWKLLLIIFPSDLQIQHELSFYFDGAFDPSPSLSTWDRRQHLNPLFSTEESVPEINEFIRLVFDRVKQRNYIGIAIEQYITSYSASHFHYQFIGLCIALESVVSQGVELSYRLKRAVSILCGENGYNCQIIFKNLDKIYSLRSKIVHGSSYTSDKIDQYAPVLRAVVSRTIIELLIHNIPTSALLSDSITKIGYGDREKITSTWKKYHLNINCDSTANVSILK